MAIEKVESEDGLKLPVYLSLRHLEGWLSQTDFAMYLVARGLDQLVSILLMQQSLSLGSSYLVLVVRPQREVELLHEVLVNNHHESCCNRRA